LVSARITLLGGDVEVKYLSKEAICCILYTRRNKMKRFSFLFFIFTVFILTFSCVVSNDNDNTIENNDSINIVNVTPKALLSPFDENNPSFKTAADGANDFAFRLSAALAENAENENFVCSPYSVWMPLAALVNATDAQYKADLLTALGAAGISQDDVNKTASRMLYDLTKEGDKGFEGYYNPLKITNAVFVGKNVTLRKEFAQVFMDYYRGSSINVDFSSRNAVDAVNRWASKNTDGLINNLVQEFDPSTVAAIANAIYFSDDWGWKFDKKKTEEGVFHAPTGEDTTAWYMLREGRNQAYYEDEELQAMPLGFKHDGYMYIVLPKKIDAQELLSSVMTNEYFKKIREDSDLAEGKLLLPRFSIQNDIKGLKEALELLGVPLFDVESAPLTDGLIEENIPVYLTDAIQKAIIKVDEKGTTAAAVTVFPAGGGSAGPQDPEPNKPFEMICDKPFVFILCERTTDGGAQILFTGIVNKPE
jgi:serpin B